MVYAWFLVYFKSKFPTKRNFLSYQKLDLTNPCATFLQWSSFYTWSSDGSNNILSNIEQTRTSFFEHRTNSNLFIHWWSNSNTLFLALNDRTSNFEPNRAFNRFTKLLFELNWTSLFWTSNELERVHLLVIELEHPIFGFEWSNIELPKLFDPSLTWRRQPTLLYFRPEHKGKVHTF